MTRSGTGGDVGRQSGRIFVPDVHGFRFLESLGRRPIRRGHHPLALTARRFGCDARAGGHHSPALYAAQGHSCFRGAYEQIWKGFQSLIVLTAVSGFCRVLFHHDGEGEHAIMIVPGVLSLNAHLCLMFTV